MIEHELDDGLYIELEVVDQSSSFTDGDIAKIKQIFLQHHYRKYIFDLIEFVESGASAGVAYEQTLRELVSKSLTANVDILHQEVYVDFVKEYMTESLLGVFKKKFNSNFVSYGDQKHVHGYVKSAEHAYKTCKVQCDPPDRSHKAHYDKAKQEQYEQAQIEQYDKCQKEQHNKCQKKLAHKISSAEALGKRVGEAEIKIWESKNIMQQLLSDIKNTSYDFLLELEQLYPQDKFNCYKEATNPGINMDKISDCHYQFSMQEAIGASVPIIGNMSDVLITQEA